MIMDSAPFANINFPLLFVRKGKYEGKVTIT